MCTDCCRTFYIECGMVLILILNNIVFAQNDNTNKLLNTDGIASGDVINNSAKV
jgi:hypothetical protein